MRPHLFSQLATRTIELMVTGVSELRARLRMHVGTTRTRITPHARHERITHTVAAGFLSSLRMKFFAKRRGARCVNASDASFAAVGWVAKPSAPVRGRRWVSYLNPAYVLIA
jgi:hypothetical protein